MKKTLALLLVAATLMGTMTACSQNNNADTPAAADPGIPTGLFTDDHKIPYGADQAIEGAAGVEREGDHPGSAYYAHPDFYTMQSSDTLTILSGFKTIQQSTEWTCGLTCVLMVMDYYDMRGEMTEMDLVPLRENDKPGATQLSQMIKTFENLEGWDVYSTYDLCDAQQVAYENAADLEVPYGFILETLKEGKPIIIGWDEWGGHYQVVIGYDTMGTETSADDVLLLADPYDTTDHCQDGYVVHSFERLYFNWINTYDDEISRNAFVVATPAAA